MNSTNTMTLLQHYFNNSDLEIINLSQSGISLICSIIILFKLFDISAFFSSVRQKREKMKKEKDRKEFEKLKKMFNSIQNHEELKLSSEEEEEEEGENDSGIMRIAHKRKKKNTTVPETQV
jgi:hypothetical protein